MRNKSLCLALLLGLFLGLPSCKSLKFERDTQTSGTFEATAWSFTFLTWDFPKLAIDIVRENVSDANLANTEVTETTRAPDLGWFNWLLEIVSFRYARLAGTWGFSGE